MHEGRGGGSGLGVGGDRGKGELSEGQGCKTMTDGIKKNHEAQRGTEKQAWPA